MNKQIIVENLRSLSKVCPIEKIQIFNDNLILIVKPDVLFDVLLFLKNHPFPNTLYPGQFLSKTSLE